MNKPTSANKKLPVSPNIKTDESPMTTVMRIRFSRKGKTSFVAHLDMMRIFERSMKRAGIDCEYSQGFNPRPVMAFALPLGVGVETLDDYIDVSLYSAIKPESFISRMNDSLPDGIEVLKAMVIRPAKESMMAKVAAAQYLFIAPGIASAVDAVKNASVLNVLKTHKGETKTIDVKALIISIEKINDDTIKAIVKAGSKENLRPDLFLDALAGAGMFSLEDAKNTQIIRTATFFVSDDGKYVRPL
ncbi:MAG: TIGR03936 family radical SAM-associated protein [Saccharofermentanales bacterium]